MASSSFDTLRRLRALRLCSAMDAAAIASTGVAASRAAVVALSIVCTGSAPWWGWCAFNLHERLNQDGEWGERFYDLNHTQSTLVIEPQVGHGGDEWRDGLVLKDLELG